MASRAAADACCRTTAIINSSAVHGEPSESPDKVFKAGTPSETTGTTEGWLSGVDRAFCKRGCVCDCRRIVGDFWETAVATCRGARARFTAHTSLQTS